MEREEADDMREQDRLEDVNTDSSNKGFYGDLLCGFGFFNFVSRKIGSLKD